LKYPPFQRLIKLTYKHKEQKICSNEAKAFADALKANTENINISYAPALIPRRHNTYRWHVYLQGENPHEALKKYLAEHPLKPGWSVDVDPVVMS
jgi:primosomal protein N'